MLRKHPAITLFALAFVVLIGAAFFVGGLTRQLDKFDTQLTTLSDQIDRLEDGQAAGKERGYKNRAVSCVDIINDQEIELTDECLDPNVVVFYPPSICAKIPPEAGVVACGTKVRDPITPTP